MEKLRSKLAIYPRVPFMPSSYWPFGEVPCEALTHKLLLLFLSPLLIGPRGHPHSLSPTSLA